MSIKQYFYNRKNHDTVLESDIKDNKIAFFCMNRRDFHNFMKYHGHCVEDNCNRYTLQEAGKLLQNLMNEVLPTYIAAIKATNDLNKVMEDDENVNGRPLEFYAVGRTLMKEVNKQIDHMYDLDCYENDGTLFVEFIQTLTRLISEMEPGDELEYFAS